MERTKKENWSIKGEGGDGEVGFREDDDERGEKGGGEDS